MSASIDSFGQFLNEAGKIALLTAEQEILLGKQVQAMQTLLATKPNGPYGKLQAATLRRGKRAQDRMVQANLRLVVMIARKYAHRNSETGITIDDLVQEGSLGLMRAAEKYDPARGYKFSTYAYWWIRQTITRYLNQRSRMIRLPNALAEKVFSINKVTHQLSNALGRRPTLNEIADALQLGRQELDLLLQRAAGVTSLDQLAIEDGSTLMEMVGTDEDSNSHLNDLHQAMHYEKLHDCMKQLNPRQAEMIALRYGLNGNSPHTYSELARVYNLSRERVRQCVDKGTRKLGYIIQSTPAMQPREKPLYKPWTLAAA